MTKIKKYPATRGIVEWSPAINTLCSNCLYHPGKHRPASVEKTEDSKIIDEPPASVQREQHDRHYSSPPSGDNEGRRSLSPPDRIPSPPEDPPSLSDGGHETEQLLHPPVSRTRKEREERQKKAREARLENIRMKQRKILHFLRKYCARTEVKPNALLARLQIYFPSTKRLYVLFQHCRHDYLPLIQRITSPKLLVRQLLVIDDLIPRDLGSDTARRSQSTLSLA